MVSLKNIHEKQFVPIDLESQIDQLCTEFEQAWLKMPRPRIEKYLTRVSPESAAVLLYELIITETALLKRGGAQLPLHDYTNRFPEHLAVISHALVHELITEPLSYEQILMAQHENTRFNTTRKSANDSTHNPLNNSLMFASFATHLGILPPTACDHLVREWQQQMSSSFAELATRSHWLHEQDSKLIQVLVAAFASIYDDGGGNSSTKIALPEMLQSCLELSAATKISAAHDVLAVQPSPPAQLDAITSIAPPPLEPTTFKPGDKIGRYLIEHKLGEGGFAEVFEALDPEIGRQVAIKIPKQNSHINLELIEAKALAKLAHPGIVSVYDTGLTNEGKRFIVFEYVPGMNLNEYLETHQLTWQKSLSLVRDVAIALNHAHTHEIVHRDIKPANILIDKQGKPKIADFGLGMHDSERWARNGEFAGSPFFMSPEQISGKTTQIDGRSDIWSLGVILYLLLCGKYPFQGRDISEIKEEIKNRDPKPVQQNTEQELPKELHAIISRCLQKLPSERYPTANALARDLQEVLTPAKSLKKPSIVFMGFLSIVIGIIVSLSLIQLKQQPPEIPQVPKKIQLAHEFVRAGKEINEDELPLLNGDKVSKMIGRSDTLAYLYILAFNEQGECEIVTHKQPNPTREIEVNLEGNFTLEGSPGYVTFLVGATALPLSAEQIEEVKMIRLSANDLECFTKNKQWFRYGLGQLEAIGKLRGFVKKSEEGNGVAPKDMEEKLRKYFSGYQGWVYRHGTKQQP